MRDLRSLLKYPNVVGFSNQLMPRISKGVETKELAIRVYVIKKVPESQLKKEEIIPKSIDGVPTDVVETGKIVAFSQTGKTSKVRPVSLGLSVSHWDVTSGSLGMLYEYEGETVAGSNAHVLCYSEDTEVLTENGFQFIKDVVPGQRVAVLNPETEEIEYATVINSIKYPFEGQLIRFLNRNIDLLVTSDHLLVVKKGRKKSITRIRAENVLDRLKNTPCPRLYLFNKAKWNCQAIETVHLPETKIESSNQYCSFDFPYAKNISEVKTEIFLKFLGWYLSEGSISKTGPDKAEHMISIRNTSETNLLEIKNIINEIGLTSYLGNNAVCFYSKQFFEYLEGLGKGSKNKSIPKEFKMLPPSQLEILFDTLMKGDGSWKACSYLTASKQLADDVQEILLKLGYSSRITIRHGSSYNPQGIYYNVSFAKRYSELRITRNNISFVPYSGYVYDLTVDKHHIILIRRNGKLCWSSNCDNPSKKPEEVTEKRILQPGSYFGGQNVDNIIGAYLWHERVRPITESCKIAGGITRVLNKLSRFLHRKSRFILASYPVNYIDFAVYSPSVEHVCDFYDNCTPKTYEFIGHLFAGSDVSGVVCKVKYILDRNFKPCYNYSTDVQVGDRTHGCSFWCHYDTTVSDPSANLIVSYGNFEAYYEDVIMLNNDGTIRGGYSGSSWFKVK